MATSKGGDLKGLDILVGMGAPSKLGRRDKTPRPMSSKSYRGRAEVDTSDGDSEDMPEDENMFDKDEEVEPDELLVGAAHDVMSAFHSRDPEGVAAALKAFVSMC